MSPHLINANGCGFGMLGSNFFPVKGSEPIRLGKAEYYLCNILQQEQLLD